MIMTLSPKQCQTLAAAELGTAIRMERAELLRAMRARDLDPRGLLRNPPSCLERMFTFDFLREIPSVGLTRLRNINRAAVLANINLATTLRDLPPSRREWLISQLPGDARNLALSRSPQG